MTDPHISAVYPPSSSLALEILLYQAVYPFTANISKFSASGNAPKTLEIM